jgi:hypothetical protein
VLQDPQPHVSISWTAGNQQQLLQEAVEQGHLSTPQQQYGLLVRRGVVAAVQLSHTAACCSCTQTACSAYLNALLAAAGS